jgi:hypothetical protein
MDLSKLFVNFLITPSDKNAQGYIIIDDETLRSSHK